MKHHLTILSLSLILVGCTASRPAPYEIKGDKFYGKGNTQETYSRNSSESDVNNDFVYRGRNGDSSFDKSYNDDMERQPSYRSGTSTRDESITSSKLAPPPKVHDSIDEGEDENRSHGGGYLNSSNMEVPSYTSEPAKKTTSSDYLDMSNIHKPIQHKEEPKKEASYEKERTDQLKDIEPKEKPKAISKEEKKSELKVSAKEKPKHLSEEKEEKQVALKEPEQEEDVTIKVPEKPQVKEEAKKPEPKKAEKKPDPKKPEEKKAEEKKEIKKAEESTPEPEAVAEPEPKKQDIASIPKLESSSGSGPAKFSKPVEGKIVGEFGGSSDGITIQAAEGTPVKAAGSGQVVYSGNQLQGYGNMVVIKHPNGFLTAYSHLEDLNIKKGAKVSQGQVIGKVGKTGNVSTPQLHFGVRKGRNAVNPRDYLN